MHQYGRDLLLTYQHPDPDWESNDSRELYNSNLARQPESWYYRDHEVRYTWNSNGYRCREWQDISWAASHVIMGCSYALGLGVDDQDTISSEIPESVNLAQCGVSVYHVQYNTIRLIQNGLIPKTVKIIVPDLARSTFWSQDTWVDLTPHDIRTRWYGLPENVRDYYQGWLSMEPNAELASYMTILGVQALWRSHGAECDLYHHWIPNNTQFQVGPALPDIVDWARDVQPNGFGHPGRQTLALWRDFIYGS